MMKLIEDLPHGVVGVEAGGQVSAEDYEQVLVPAVEAARASAPDGRVSLRYVLGHEMPDYTVGAGWQDAKLGLGRLHSWNRIAVVTDTDWVRHEIHSVGWLVPGEVKVYPVGDLDEARAWVTAGD